MPKYVIAIDQGTTSTRSILFDNLGQIVALDQVEHSQIYTQPGWVEHDPLEILTKTKLTLERVVGKSPVSISDIQGIGITNQRETTVLWDKDTGIPVSNAIVWQDTRTDKICRTLLSEIGNEFVRERTGLPISTYFSAPKIKYLLENHPEIKDRILRNKILFGTMDTWLIWNLTGGPSGGLHVTDVTNASRTMLFNINKLVWDQDLLNLLDIPIEIMPKVQASSAYLGDAHFPFGSLPIAGILGDQQAALFGQNCHKVGQAKNTYGTGCFILMNTGQKPVSSKNGLITTIAYQLENQSAQYCLEGSIAITGALVQWLRDNLKIIKNSYEVEEMANQVQDNGGIYFVPAFSGLFAPHWRPDARGIIIGLSHHTTSAHIARAALEATAYQTLDVISAMELDSGIKISALKVDGGMAQNHLLLQFQSDILGKKLLRPKVTETTALGAAFVAGIALGVWRNIHDLNEIWQEDKTYLPEMSEDVRNHLIEKWRNAVSRTLDWI
jgi:glycerol kinase